MKLNPAVAALLLSGCLKFCNIKFAMMLYNIWNVAKLNVLPMIFYDSISPYWWCWWYGDLHIFYAFGTKWPRARSYIWREHLVKLLP